MKNKNKTIKILFAFALGLLFSGSAYAEGSIDTNAPQYYNQLKAQIESDAARIVTPSYDDSCKCFKDNLGAGFNFGNSLDLPNAHREYRLRITIGNDDGEYYIYDDKFNQEANLFNKDNRSSSTGEYASIKFQLIDGVTISDDTELNHIEVTIRNYEDAAQDRDLTLNITRFQLIDNGGNYLVSNSSTAGKYTLQIPDDHPVQVLKKSFHSTTNADFFGDDTVLKLAIQLEDFVSDFKDNPTRVYDGSNGVVATDEELAFLKAEGIKSIRLPITWFSHMDYTGTVDADWFEEVNKVVDRILSYGFYVIVDIHHDAGKNGWIKADQNYLAKYGDAYRYLFLQIAENFKNYDHRVILEAPNEIINYKNTWHDTTHNTVPDEDYAAANTINQMFVDEVRRTGYNNTDRFLIVGSYGAQIETLPKFVMPTDTVEDRIFVGLHEYKLEDNGILQSLNFLASDEGAEYLTKYNYLLTEYAIERAETLENKLAFVDKNVKLATELNFPAFWWDEGGDKSLMVKRGSVWDEAYNSDQVARRMISTIYDNMVTNCADPVTPVNPDDGGNGEDDAILAPNTGAASNLGGYAIAALPLIGFIGVFGAVIAKRPRASKVHFRNWKN